MIFEGCVNSGALLLAKRTFAAKEQRAAENMFGEGEKKICGGSHLPGSPVFARGKEG